MGVDNRYDRPTTGARVAGAQPRSGQVTGAEAERIRATFGRQLRLERGHLTAARLSEITLTGGAVDGQ